MADLGGVRPARTPPYGSRFFRFDMQNFRNVAALGVHGPPVRGPRPPMGNPGSATENYTWKFVKIPGNIMEKIMKFCHCRKMGTLCL